MDWSWVTEMLLKMWFAIDTPTEVEWKARFESSFCVKVFHSMSELEGWEVVREDTKSLFWYQSEQPLGSYINSQGQVLRTLYQNYNTAVGYDRQHHRVGDMCSEIDAMFAWCRITG